MLRAYLLRDTNFKQDDVSRMVGLKTAIWRRMMVQVVVGPDQQLGTGLFDKDSCLVSSNSELDDITRMLQLKTG